LSFTKSNPNSEADEQSIQADASAVNEPASEPRFSAADLASSGALDGLFEQIDSGQVQLSGSGGLLPELIKAVLERGLQAEMTGHLGYEKGDPDASLYRNSRNGSSDKTVASEVGDVLLSIPRDRNGSFTPRLVPKGQRRLGGLDEMSSASTPAA
jgi:putative transposase